MTHAPDSTPRRPRPANPQEFHCAQNATFRYNIFNPFFVKEVFMLADLHLGSYQIMEQIGVGGMATVYRARQPSMDRIVAIKVIQGGLTDPAAIQRFQREARLVARLEHPHILPVYDFDAAHDPPYIVMRCLDGGTLEAVLERGPLPPIDAAVLMRQVCAGLDYAHRQGVIHRDVKPSNILIDQDGNAFVSDFGIARSAEGSASLRLTQEGMVLGSVEYMSPEQVMGRRDIDPRSDLYSLGVLLFQMLSGHLPYESDPPLGVLAMHLNAPIPSLHELCPHLPPEIDAVIQKALAKSRDDRYTSAVVLSASLDAALGLAAGSAREGAYLRELAGAPAPGGEAGLARGGGVAHAAAPVTEHNRPIVAMYVNAAEYAEMIEAAADREEAHRASLALWERFLRIVEEAGGLALAHSESDLLAVWGANPALLPGREPASSREDDAERAVLAALDMQSTMREATSAATAGVDSGSDDLPLNIGIHSGLALISPLAQPNARTGAYAVTGATISLSNRLMQAAYGCILITHEVYRQVRGVFEVQPDLPLRVRGRAEGVPTYRVSAAKPRAFRPSTRGVEGVETRLVGRETELRRLQHAFLNAVEDGETQVVTLTGEAGVGKSRLLDAFDQWCELRPEMYFLFRGRASGMPNRPYALLRSLVAFRCGIREDDPPAAVIEKLEAGINRIDGPATPPELADPALAARIGYLCGYPLAESPHIRPLLADPGQLALQARQALLTLFLSLARAGIVLMELDDLHLADDASLDLFNEIFAACAASTARDAGCRCHLTAACAARPALFSRRPDWGRDPSIHSRVDLLPLDRRESRELVREILKKLPEVPRPLRDLLVDRAEGNPYYLEELVKMLIDDRVIVPESDALWRVEETRLVALKAPPSLAALIETRLDTLLAPERLALLRAAVFGRVFYSGALQAMDGAEVRAHGTAAHIADLPGVLSGLARRQFIHAHETSTLAGSAEYVFDQSLLRDVVYDLLLDRQRKLYHRAAADWLSSLQGGDAFLSQIAEHYEQAGAWEDAALALEQAGARAFRRGLFREAEALYERGLSALVSDEPSLRLDLLLGLGEAANGRGDLPRALPALEEALALARAQGAPSTEARACCLLGAAETTRGNYPTALAYFDLALPLARKKGERRVLANVLYGLADTCFRAGAYDRAMAAAQECRELARRLGDDVLLATAINRIATVHEMRHETEKALPLLQEGLALARRTGHRRLEMALLINMGVYHFVQNAFEPALQAWETSMPIARESGDLFAQTINAANLAVAYARLGPLDNVMPLVRESLQSARQMRSQTGLLRALLGAAELRLAQGDAPGGLALLGLARWHPAAAADHIWGADQGLRYWQARLGLDPVETAALAEQGRALDLDQEVRALLPAAA
jgi:tetratricopeptide (TPR) repeat protein